MVAYDLSELKDEQLKALTAVEVATRNKAAKILDYGAQATGQADVIDQRAQKIKDHGESGLAASQHEAIETAAEKGATTLFSGLGGSSSSDNADLLRAILAELKKESKK